MTPEQLRQWRKINRYSRRQLAVILGVSGGSIGNWERGIFPTPSWVPLALAAIERGIIAPNLGGANGVPADENE